MISTVESSFLNSKITRFKESRLQNSRSPHQCYLRFKVENRRLKKWAAFRKFWLIIIHRARLDRSIKYCYDGETSSHNMFVSRSLLLTDMFTVCRPAWCCGPAPACRPASAYSWTRPPPGWWSTARCTWLRTWNIRGLQRPISFNSFTIFFQILEMSQVLEN